jgi:hypothetical protein
LSAFIASYPLPFPTQQLSKIVGAAPEVMRLLTADAQGSYTVADNNKSLADARVEDGGVMFLSLKIGNSFIAAPPPPPPLSFPSQPDTADGTDDWEQVSVHPLTA